MPSAAKWATESPLATQQESSAGFTDTLRGMCPGPRHSVEPSAARCSSSPFIHGSLTQHDPSVGFAETEAAQQMSPGPLRHSSVPSAARCTTWWFMLSATQQDPSYWFTDTE